MKIVEWHWRNNEENNKSVIAIRGDGRSNRFFRKMWRYVGPQDRSTYVIAEDAHSFHAEIYDLGDRYHDKVEDCGGRIIVSGHAYIYVSNVSQLMGIRDQNIEFWSYPQDFITRENLVQEAEFRKIWGNCYVEF